MQALLEDKVIDNFAKKNGLRTMMYAYKDINSDHWEDLQAANNNFTKESDRAIIETDLVFVAAFGLKDDLRDGVEKSIRQLRASNINTRIISGDNLETAINTAKKAGILRDGEESLPMTCMIGEEFYS
jgi:P-type Ca2+ transporter type 2C